MVCYSCFELSIPDRYRHIPDQNDSLLIYRVTDFVFPTGFPVPAPVPELKMQ